MRFFFFNVVALAAFAYLFTGGMPVSSDALNDAVLSVQQLIGVDLKTTGKKGPLPDKVAALVQHKQMPEKIEDSFAAMGKSLQDMKPQPLAVEAKQLPAPSPPPIAPKVVEPLVEKTVTVLPVHTAPAPRVEPKGTSRVDLEQGTQMMSPKERQQALSLLAEDMELTFIRFAGQ